MNTFDTTDPKQPRGFRANFVPKISPGNILWRPRAIIPRRRHASTAINHSQPNQMYEYVILEREGGGPPLPSGETGDSGSVKNTGKREGAEIT